MLTRQTWNRLPGHILLVVTLAFLVGSGCRAQETEKPVPSEEPATSQSGQRPPQSGRSRLNPAQTVTAMLDAYLDGRLGEYYQFVSTTDKEVKSLDSLQAEFAPTAADIVTDFLFSETRFGIDSARVAGDSARVYVTSKSPPFEFVLQQAQIVERDLGADTDMSTKLSVLNERHRLSGGPFEENQTMYRLIREDGGWRVIVGWAELAAFLDASIAEQEAVDSLSRRSR